MPSANISKTKRVNRRASGKPAGSPADDVIASALDAIFSDVNKSNAPGLIVGVARQGRTIYRKGFGMASLEHASANTPATRMRVASVSKQFTCFGALLLAEEGKLDIDAPINGLLPELPRLAGYPTFRQLMSHAGGLHDTADMHFMSRGLAPAATFGELQSAVRQTSVNFAPGKGQLYSNTGYGLLSIAIARTSGMSFEQFMKTRVFEPLGMIDSESIPSDMMIVPGLATMHQAMPDGRWRRGMTSGEDNHGAGATVSTVDDLLIWLAQLRGPVRKIGNSATWKQLTEVATLDNGYRTAYALGVVCNTYRGLEVMQHGGSLIGVLSQIITVPSHAIDVVVVANCEVHNSVELSYRIIEALVGEKALAPKPSIATSDRFKHLFGARYHADSGMTVGFDDVGGKLGFSFLYSPPIPMLEDHGDELRLGGAGTGPFVLKVSELASNANGEAPETITLTDAGFVQLLRRLPDNPPAAVAAGRDLLGRYEVADLDATARVEIEGETLVLHIDTPQGTRSATLEALSKDVFGVLVRDPVFPARYVITVDRTSKDLKAFNLDGGRTRHIRFAPAAD